MCVEPYMRRVVECIHPERTILGHDLLWQRLCKSKSKIFLAAHGHGRVGYHQEMIVTGVSLSAQLMVMYLKLKITVAPPIPHLAILWHIARLLIGHN